LFIQNDTIWLVVPIGAADSGHRYCTLHCEYSAGGSKRTSFQLHWEPWWRGNFV